MALIALSTLVAAIVVFMARAVSSQKGLNSRLGKADWYFNGSWASNLAAVGSVLGILIGASTYTGLTTLPLAAIVLSVLFGTLTVVGPIIYAALQVVQSDQLEGTLGGFYLASGLTLWAALGELVAALVFFVDLSAKLSPLLIALFFVVVAVAIGALLRYAWLSAGWVASLAVAPSTGRAPTKNLQDFHLI